MFFSIDAGLPISQSIYLSIVSAFNYKGNNPHSSCPHEVAQTLLFFFPVVDFSFFQPQLLHSVTQTLVGSLKVIVVSKQKKTFSEQRWKTKISHGHPHYVKMCSSAINKATYNQEREGNICPGPLMLQ